MRNREPQALDAAADAPLHPAGLTVADVARRFRVGEDKVRAWIRRGELLAVNTADVACGRPRYVVTPDALAEFEKRRTTAPPAKPRRRKKPSAMIDYFPD